MRYPAAGEVGERRGQRCDRREPKLQPAPPSHSGGQHNPLRPGIMGAELSTLYPRWPVGRRLGMVDGGVGEEGKEAYPGGVGINLELFVATVLPGGLGF